MSETLSSLKETLEPYFYNSWTVDEMVGYIQSQEAERQPYILKWVISIAKTQPELAYQ